MKLKYWDLGVSGGTCVFDVNYLILFEMLFFLSGDLIYWDLVSVCTYNFFKLVNLGENQNTPLKKGNGIRKLLIAD